MAHVDQVRTCVAFVLSIQYVLLFLQRFYLGLWLDVTGLSFYTSFLNLECHIGFIFMNRIRLIPRFCFHNLMLSLFFFLCKTADLFISTLFILNTCLDCSYHFTCWPRMYLIEISVYLGMYLEFQA